MRLYANQSGIRFLFDMGFYDLIASCIAHNDYNLPDNLLKFLRANKDRIPLMQKMKMDKKDLLVLAHMGNKRFITEEVIAWIILMPSYYKETLCKILKYATPLKMINYINKNVEQNERHNHSSIINIWYD